MMRNNIERNRWNCANHAISTTLQIYNESLSFFSLKETFSVKFSSKTIEKAVFVFPSHLFACWIPFLPMLCYHVLKCLWFYHAVVRFPWKCEGSKATHGDTIKNVVSAKRNCVRTRATSHDHGRIFVVCSSYFTFTFTFNHFLILNSHARFCWDAFRWIDWACFCVYIIFYSRHGTTHIFYGAWSFVWNASYVDNTWLVLIEYKTCRRHSWSKVLKHNGNETNERWGKLCHLFSGRFVPLLIGWISSSSLIEKIDGNVVTAFC